MSILSGKDGAIDGIATVMDWDISSSQDLQAWVASNTKEGTVRSPGPEDWSGSYTAMGPIPAKKPGDEFTFTGSIDNANGAVGAAKVDEVEIRLDQEGGSPIAHTVRFSSNGALALGAAVATDATIPTALSPLGCKVHAAEAIGTPVFSEIDDIRSVTFTMRRANPAYVSSGTYASGKAATKRATGAFDCTVSMSYYQGDPTKFIAPGSIKHLKLFIGPAVATDKFWEIKWVRFQDVRDVRVNLAGEIVGASQDAHMMGYADVDGTTPTEGYIKTPEASPATWWP